MTDTASTAAVSTNLKTRINNSNNKTSATSFDDCILIDSSSDESISDQVTKRIKTNNKTTPEPSDTSVNDAPQQQQQIQLDQPPEQQQEQLPQDQQSPNQQQPQETSTSIQVPVENQEEKRIFVRGPYVPIFRRDGEIFIDPRGILKSYFESSSEYSPTLVDKRLACEVLPDDAIVEAPSLVTPLLLKKKTNWPERIDEDDEAPKTNENNPIETDDIINNPGQDQTPSRDDIQVVKVVNTNNRLKRLNNRRSVEEYIKATTVASLTNLSLRTQQKDPIPSIRDFFKSSAGEMLVGIGLSRVQEFNLLQKSKVSARRLKRVSDDIERIRGATELESIKQQLAKARAVNQVYKGTTWKRCPKCPFKTEYSIVMSGHFEVPHMSSRKELICNWCDFKTFDFQRMLFHCMSLHKKRCRIDKPPLLHQCRYCEYENRSKSKMNSHVTRCEKLSYYPQTYLSPKGMGEDEFPAITSKLITQEDIKMYENTLKALRLAAYNPHQLRISNPQGTQPILIVPRQNGGLNSMIDSDNPVVANGQAPNNQLSRAQNGPANINLRNLVASAVNFGGANQQTAGGSTAIANQNNNHSVLLMNLLATRGSCANNTTGILQHPKGQSSFVNGKSILKTASDFVMGPNGQTNTSNCNHTSQLQMSESDLRRTNEQGSVEQTTSANSSTTNTTPNPKGSTFVICEICDAYIKDLSQLKSHMQWVHKVKIHQKMLLSRPPLSCQKCQWRFFTDQGLERHLLGAHGLVTSNMQELVDQGKDSGRCTVCGRAYANSLVAHMREAHKTNLKPAYLTYKCTVCSAQFNLYQLFENHVYSVHSESVRCISSK